MKVNFTQRALRAIAPPATGRLVVWDTEVRGLGMRITASGERTFFLQRHARGRQYRLTIGRWDTGVWPETTIDQARLAASEAIAAINRGDDPRPAPPATPAPPALTLAGLWPVYLERHAKPRKRTVRGDEGAWKLYLVEFRDRPLVGISRGEVAAWHVRLWRERGAATANRALALLRIMYRLAGDWELYAGGNPAARIEKAPERPRQRAVERDEFPALLRAIHAHPGATARDALLLALWTGQRIGNVLAMRWDQLAVWREPGAGGGPLRGTWTIPRTKNDDAHAVPLTDLALEIIEARRPRAADNPHVLPGQRPGAHLVGVSHAWAAIKLDAAKACPSLADLRVHDLRRTMASWQVRTGATLAVTAASLAHRNIETTRKVYAIIDTEPRRLAMEAATRKMQEMADIKPGDDQHGDQQRASGGGGSAAGD